MLFLFHLSLLISNTSLPSHSSVPVERMILGIGILVLIYQELNFREVKWFVDHHTGKRQTSHLGLPPKSVLLRGGALCLRGSQLSRGQEKQQGKGSGFGKRKGEMEGNCNHITIFDWFNACKWLGTISLSHHNKYELIILIFILHEETEAQTGTRSCPQVPWLV